MQLEGSIARLQIERPDVLNAIDMDVCDELIEHMDALGCEPDVKVVVISGAGERAFSSGADLKYVRSVEGPKLRRYIEKTWTAFDAIAKAPFISIAALHGFALGGGAELALACDMRVAAADSQFGFPEMVLGSVPGSGGMQRLPQLVGRSVALELVTLGTRLGADDACRLGLVNRMADAGREEAIRASLALANEIAKRPAESLRYAKLAVGLSDDPYASGAIHGLISAVRHADPAYEKSTDRFGRN